MYNMGQRLAQRRKALNLTQERLAEKAGVSTQMISNMELGKKAVRPENLFNICEALDLSVDYALSGWGEDKSEKENEERIRNINFITDCFDNMTSAEIRVIKDLIECMQAKK